MTPPTISVFNLVGSSFCVEANDGDCIFAAISKALQQDQVVALSFQNVEILTAAFLNTAIGQLYGVFSQEKIRALINVADMDKVDQALLRRVIVTAKFYYQNPTSMNVSVEQIVSEDV
jgi:hypothetical protein